MIWLKKLRSLNQLIGDYEHLLYRSCGMSDLKEFHLVHYLNKKSADKTPADFQFNLADFQFNLKVSLN